MLAEQTLIQPQNLRAYQGGFFRVQVSPEQTDGAFAMIEFNLPQGSEPPRHIHTREDETFHILDGTVRFEIGNTVITAEKGQTVFAPRLIEHQFKIQTEQARILTLITPGDFANFFLESSQPITEVPATLEAPKGPPPADVIARIVARLSDRYASYLA
ncbi:cupin domain-containing protein [Larkinella terrae]|uniref:Cupin domain-containing protein n=1 Tax=Larkinella terrae TaxID=2025311 RepID=A0A7K0ESJ9_9BACT|nr:cupin domain-containing protein [Larkinella terrae]MRS64794.1 cupin domain-containing protein [Larkinella terrae]